LKKVFEYLPQTIQAFEISIEIPADKGIDLREVRGTGPNNRIIKADILEFTPTQKPAESPRTAPKQVSGVSTTPFDDIEVTQIRKVIANRLTQSKQNIPHYYLTIECNVDSLLNLRTQLNEYLGNAELKLSVNDFVVKASASVMKKVPMVNSEWRGDVIRQYKDVHVSVAVSTDRGLITPIIREANKKGISEISSDVKRLADKAKKSSLSLNEIEGGTFTISNLGMFGIKSFAAVINPPQSAILAVGTTEKKLVLDGEKVKTINTMSFTLSCDHRVIDGAVGAQWLQEFKKIIENPSSLML